LDADADGASRRAQPDGFELAVSDPTPYRRLAQPERRRCLGDRQQASPIAVPQSFKFESVIHTCIVAHDINAILHRFSRCRLASVIALREAPEIWHTAPAVVSVREPHGATRPLPALRLLAQRGSIN
jgi:hypothetical protein